MNVEMSKANAPETPASAMTDYMTEHVSALMIMGGIESISAQRYNCGFGTRLHVTIAPFAKAPEAVRTIGIVIKDAIAQILSSANVTRLVLKPSDEEMADVTSTWSTATKDAKMANSGSGQDFSERGSSSEAQEKK